MMRLSVAYSNVEKCMVMNDIIHMLIATEKAKPQRSVVSLQSCDLIIWDDFIHMTQIGHYTGIPTSRVSAFKLRRVFVLFPRLMQ